MEQEVMAAVQKYVDGCRTADADMVRDAFAEDSVMWGYLQGEYVHQSGADFAAHVIGPAEPAGEEFSYDIHSIQVTGEVANAILDERGFLGLDFRNYFGLVRRDGTWRIVSKVFMNI